MNWKGMKNMVVLALLVSGCSASAKPFVIEATTNLKPNTLVYLTKVTDAKLEFVDTVRTSPKGEFEFKGETDAVSRLFYLTFDKQNPPGVPIIIENGAKLSLDINQTNVIRYTISGGKYNQQMLKLHNLYVDHDVKMMEFNAEVAEIKPEDSNDRRKEISERYGKLLDERSEDIERFIRTEPASPATYFAVKYLFQRPVPKLVLVGSEKMSKEFPGSPYTETLAKEAAVIGPTVEGALAPDIKLLTPEGDSLALSSLRGKVVLIDFWASWCGPCRRENPSVVKVYQKYKDKGFDIYGVSLDKNMQHWQAAIAKDGLTWHHVSDLKGWSSSAARLYGVRSIPQTYLLDKDGRVIKSGIRSEELDSILGEILN